MYVSYLSLSAAVQECPTEQSQSVLKATVLTKHNTPLVQMLVAMVPTDIGQQISSIEVAQDQEAKSVVCPFAQLTLKNGTMRIAIKKYQWHTLWEAKVQSTRWLSIAMGRNTLAIARLRKFGAEGALRGNQGRPAKR